jgi:hypothetical protein
LPGAVIAPGPGRVAYLAADLDRCYARDHQPDHAQILADLVRWGLGDSSRISLHGSGLIDYQAYLQPGRIVVHLVNLTNPGAWRPPVTELLPIGAQQLTIRVDDLGILPRTAELRVAGRRIPISGPPSGLRIDVESLLDHELIVLEHGR